MKSSKKKVYKTRDGAVYDSKKGLKRHKARQKLESLLLKRLPAVDPSRIDVIDMMKGSEYIATNIDIIATAILEAGIITGKKIHSNHLWSN